MTFQGIDWTELTMAFGLFNELDNNETVLKKTRDYLLENHFPEANSSMANTIRLFVKALYDRCLESNRYSTPLWRGLLDIKDDQTLVKYTIVLLEHMWF